MVVTKAVEGGNRLGCVFFPIVVYKGEALALAGHLVLGKENPGNMSKRLEEFLQVGFLGVFREIRHPDGSSVFPPPVGHHIASRHSGLSIRHSTRSSSAGRHILASTSCTSRSRSSGSS